MKERAHDSEKDREAVTLRQRERPQHVTTWNMHTHNDTTMSQTKLPARERREGGCGPGDDLLLDSVHGCYVLVRGAIARSGRETFHRSLRARFELDTDEENLEQSELLRTLLEFCERFTRLLKSVRRTYVRAVCEHHEEKAAGLFVVEKVLEELQTHRMLENFLRCCQNSIVEGRPPICPASHASQKDRHESRSSSKTNQDQRPHPPQSMQSPTGARSCSTR